MSSCPSLILLIDVFASKPSVLNDLFFCLQLPYGGRGNGHCNGNGVAAHHSNGVANNENLREETELEISENIRHVLLFLAADLGTDCLLFTSSYRTSFMAKISDCIAAQAVSGQENLRILYKVQYIFFSFLVCKTSIYIHIDWAQQ
jgi:hypothetical protein